MSPTVLLRLCVKQKRHCEKPKPLFLIPRVGLNRSFGNLTVPIAIVKTTMNEAFFTPPIAAEEYGTGLVS
jgi:hypothetical protein